MNKKVTGNLGEEIAVNFMSKSGYKIIDRNFRSKIGEIDIIALDKINIVFVEVKTRTSTKYGFPSDAVSLYKQSKIIKVAELYLSINKKFINLPARFDVIEVFLHPYTYALDKINHIVNAFTL